MAMKIENIVAIIMGGGRGTRLYPLTSYRSKPAVPFAGKYRLIDIPISNCLHSNIKKIFILTQFNSESLNTHLARTYRFDSFTDGFVTILAAEQSMENTNWYQGTADAVRKNMLHILTPPHKYDLVLSGDQIYQMDYRKLIEFHISKKADVTVATLPVTENKVPGFGIMKINDNQRIIEFVEKPKDKEIIKSLRISKDTLIKNNIDENSGTHLASMGIYLFKKEVLKEVLKDESKTDFGKEIIPAAIKNYKVYAFLYSGYWEDVGTIRSFFEANLAFTYDLPPFNLYQEGSKIFTHPRFLPPAKFNNAIIDHSIIAEGCIIDRGTIRHSIVGIRSIIDKNAVIDNSIIMGNDSYGKLHERKNFIIGENSIISNAIIDKNVTIGKNCKIINQKKRDKHDGKKYFIRDGIIIIPKNTVIPSNTII